MGKKAKAKASSKAAKEPTEETEHETSALTKTGAVTNFQPPKYQDEDMHIKVSGIDINYYGKHILVNQTLNLTLGHRYGLVGVNGCGKSTLLNVLGAGEIPMPPRVNYFHLREEVKSSDARVIDVVLEANTEHTRLTEELDALQERDDQGEDPVASRIEVIFERLDELEAESAEARAAGILIGLGFDHAMQLRPTSSFSGGWRMRVALAQALFLNPTCLLLDEPTNHLDIEACVWLERYLQRFKGIILMVSHSQDFMNGVCTDTIRMHKGELKFYSGGYDDYRSTRKELEINQMKIREKEQADIADIKDFVARFGHGTQKMVKQAQSRQKILDKMIAEGLTPDIEREASICFNFPNAGKLPPPVIAFDDVAFKYPKMEKMLYHDVNIGVDSDSKICLVGPNGAGKTTLIKLMMGDLEPVEGMIKRNQHSIISHFSQHSVDQLDMELSPLAFFQEKWAQEKDVQVHRQWLGKFGVTGQVQTQVMGTLSDGQKSRVVLSMMARKNPHLLILDEPTNHLDMESIDELARSLNVFEGGVVLISHDMRLIQQVCSQILIADNNTVTPFKGDIAAYKKLIARRVEKLVAKHEEKQQQGQKSAPKSTSKPAKKPDAKKAEAEQKAKLAQAEAEMKAKMEKAKAEADARVKAEAEARAKAEAEARAKAEAEAKAKAETEAKLQAEAEAEQSAWKARITRMYQEYQPESVAKIDGLMQKYDGKDGRSGPEELLKAIVGKYGPEPAAPDASVPIDWKARITRMYEKYQPDNVAKVDALMQKYDGKDGRSGPDELLRAIVGKYGPEPPTHADPAVKDLCAP